MLFNYFSRVPSAIQHKVCRSVSGKESGNMNQVDFLLGKGKVLLGYSRLVNPMPSGILIDLHVLVRPVTLAAAQAKSHLASRTKNFSVFSVFSYAITTPSVSGPSFQVCQHHVDCMVSEPSQRTCIKSDAALMDFYRPRSAPATCSISDLSSLLARPGAAAYQSFSSYSRRSFHNGKTASTHLRNKEQLNNNFLLYGYFMYNVAKRRGYANPFSTSKFEELHISSISCSSARTARDLSFGDSLRDEQQPTDTSKLNITVAKTLKLNSGSCYLPHPDKEKTGGEDAHFICSDEQAIGVADGVGGWADVGVDAGEYSRELMSNSVNAIQEEPRGSIDPARVLKKAYAGTEAKGSSTACIIALTDQGLLAINLGDSGFMVVRDGCTVYRSSVQQHDFNFTYQLECGNDSDLPSSGQVSTIAIAPGDVIICGTDGLFDNLYDSDITAVVVHAVRAGFGPEVTAQKIAALARKHALDSDRQTPFSTAAQEAGFRYHGGKLDDITVVVSYVASDNNESQSTQGF